MANLTVDQTAGQVQLLPEAEEMLHKSDEERITYIKTPKWIPYTKAIVILDKLEELLHEPKNDRMPSLLIVGSPNNGKTSLAREFGRMHPPTDGLVSDAYPVMYVQAPPVPDETRLYNDILRELDVAFNYKNHPSEKLATIHYYFSLIDVRIFIVDDIQGALSGSALKQRAFMNALRGLSNALKIPIVLIGTRDALRVTSTDLQISSRFRPMVVPRWKLDEDYVRLLASIEQVTPLKKPYNLAIKEIALEVLDLCEGYIGEIIELIKCAAIIAIKTKSERITLKEIKAVNFVKPSLRKTHAELGDI